jgi:hypothetical protein
MGLYLTPFLRRLETSVQHIVMRVKASYAQAYADCGAGAPTAAQIATSTNPAAKFLASMPCDTASEKK